MTTGRILNIPNILTLARIALIPVFLLVAYWPPAIGTAAPDGNMTRHILLTAILRVHSIKPQPLVVFLIQSLIS